MQILFTDERIPKIVITADGTVLAFADSCHLLRRSEDRGETWSEVQQAAPEGKATAVVDETTDDVLVVCPRHECLLRSSDAGETWQEEAISIAPNGIGHGTPDGVPADGAASSAGITLRHGEHAGRLVLPVRIQPPEGTNAQEYWQYNYNTSMISDDGGESWQVGEPVQSGTGEGTLAELSDGRLYYNSRCHMAVDHRRRIAWSHDGGYRWTDWQVSEDLFELAGPHYFKYGRDPSYGCNAGLVRVPDEVTGGRDVLVYSAPDNPGAISPYEGRIRMTVWASIDGAESWPAKRLVYEGISVYSCLAADREGNIYLLFESGEQERYESIKFFRFNLEWLGVEE